MLKTISNYDWVSILLFFLLVGFGWGNIYSASLSTEVTSLLDLSQAYGKQLLWILLSLLLIVIVLSTDAKFYEKFSGVIYIAALVALLGLFVFGKTISGATSWYNFGSFSIQPSEFAKTATALALAKYISDIETNVRNIKHQLRAFAIVAIPALIIVPQPDPGSALVYAAFFFPLYREGLSGAYLAVGLSAIVLFIATLLFNPLKITIAVFAILALTYIINRKRKPKLWHYMGILILAVGFSYSVNYIFNNVFEQRHRDRFNIVLGKETDSKGIGYNTNQSEIAIGSGGWTGKGWTQGTQTKGGFVPEQHTDYIFSTVGEEWGFIGSAIVILLFVALLLRLIILAERQKKQFTRIYGYSVIGILFIHFLVNIGMVTGIFPTVGIPLPFFSYGGSGLWGFTLLLFVFIKLDSERLSFWR